MSPAAARTTGGKPDSLPTAAVGDHAKAISPPPAGVRNRFHQRPRRAARRKAGSVSAMIKLDEAGLVERVPYHGSG